MNIIPLFETIGDLQASAKVMDRIFGLAAYRALVTSRGEEHEVMLGYSDSNKDGGFSHFRLGTVQGRGRADRGVQEAAASVCASSTAAAARRPRRRPELPGHPGAAGRRRLRARSASPNRARSSPPNIRIRKSVVATSKSSRRHAGGDPAQPRARGRTGRLQCGDHGHAFHWPSAYRGLVYETDGFRTYFRESTVVSKSRSSTSAAARPRARPPTPSRTCAPSRGVQLGTVPPDAAGLVWLRHCRRHLAVRQPERLDTLRKMPTLALLPRTLLSNMDMVLSKTDLSGSPRATPAGQRTGTARGGVRTASARNGN